MEPLCEKIDQAPRCVRKFAPMRKTWAALLLATVAASVSSPLHAAPSKAGTRASAPKKDGAKEKAKPKESAKPEPKAKSEPKAKPEPKAAADAKASPKRAPTAIAGERIRRAIAGGPIEKESPEDFESSELRMLREIDRELFPAYVHPPPSEIELPIPLPALPRHPVVSSSGLPRAPLAEPSIDDGERDLSWLHELVMPDLPARWDARVIRYLEYYRNNPRGRSVVALSMKRSGRWVGAMRATLRAQGLPEDLVWASLVESAFNPTARSHAGAAGLWQFMPGTARIYGLTVDANVDERLDPSRATEAAARHLGDLHRRFGSWELALAAYNMGYGGLLAAVRKFNTNDFWELGRWEAGIPWETTLYVPKIIAMAIIAKNPAVFGHEGVEREPAFDPDPVPIAGPVSLKAIAAAANVPESEIAALNPQFRKGKIPERASSAGEPSSPWIVYVPAGQGPTVAKRFHRGVAYEGKLERHLVRFGESLDTLAEDRGISKSHLIELNGLREGETLRARSSLLLPAGSKLRASAVVDEEDKPVIVVPPIPPGPEGQRRVFYRVLSGDTLAEIAAAFDVLPDDLRRWNALDPGARLHEGMSLQLFVPEEANLAKIVCLEEEEARVLVVGSEEFFAHFEGLRGRKRAVVTVQPGDTWQKLGQRYGLSLGSLERINRRPRRDPLTPGETVVIYAPIEKTIPEALLAETEPPEAEPLPEAEAPNPEDLPEAKEAEPEEEPAEPALARGEGE